MKHGWEDKKLGEVFDITSSKRVFKADWKSSGVPFYRAREIVKLARQGYVENELYITEEMYAGFAAKFGAPKPGDLLVTGVGTLGVVYVVKDGDRFYFKDGNIIWFKKKTDVNPQFVKYIFQTDSMQRYIQDTPGATVGTFTIDKAKNTIVQLPPLNEQERIVSILDKANVIRHKRQQTILLADEFLRAVFLNMFGDPVTNPKGWQLGSFSDICEINPRGKECDDELIVGFVPMSAVSEESERIDVSETRRLAEVKKGFTPFLEGDVLFAKITPCMENGKAGIATNLKNGVGYGSTEFHVFRPKDPVYSMFVYSLVHLEIFRKLAADRFSGAVGHKRVPKDFFESFKLYLPPLNLIEKYSRIFTSLREVQDRMNAGSAGSNDVFGSLSQKAFLGGLSNG